MHGIKKVGGILEAFSAKAFPTVIEPDGDEGQQSESLCGKIVCTPKQREALAFEQDDVQKQHGNQLSELSEPAFMEYIECHHCHNALPTVVHETDET